MLFRLALRHLIRHWRLNLLLWLTLVVATTLLAVLPVFAAVIADRSLRQTLAESSPSSRNLLVSGDLDVGLAQSIQDSLGELYERRVRYRVTEDVELQQRVARADGSEREVVEFLRWRAFALDDLQNHVRVVEGRLPAFVPQTNPLRQPTHEVAMGRDAVEAFDMRLGDEVATADGGQRVQVVGIVEPLDPTEDYWFEDLLLFELTRIPGGNLPDTIVLPVIVPPQSITTYFSPRETWRVFTRWQTISLDNAVAVRDALSGLLASQSGVSLATGLLLIIDAYQAELVTARFVLFLLSAQSMLFVLYLLLMAAEAALETARRELVTLFGRGFAPREITILYAVQFGLLAAIAVPAGPAIGRAALGSWLAAMGERLTSATPALAWQLALAGGLGAWLFLSGAIYLGVRDGWHGWQAQLTRPAGRTRWARAGLDFFLLALGALAYWQLGQRGSFVLGAAADQVADPLLLLGPTALLLAVALLLLRLLPPLARLAAWLWRRRPGVVGALGLTRLARAPAGPSRVVLLVSLTAALALFAGAFSGTTRQRQAAFARFFNGADLRLALAPDLAAAAAQQEWIAALPGVAGSAMAFRARVQRPDEPGARPELLAVDPAALPGVAAFPEGLTTLTLEAMMAVIAPEGGRVLPAIFAVATEPEDKGIGDQMVYRLGSENIAVEVRGIARNFPSLSRRWAADAFIVVSLPALEGRVDLARVGGVFERQRELWVRLAPGADEEAILAALPEGVRPLGSAGAELAGMGASLVAQETSGAFSLNALTLVGLSLLGFALVYALAGQRRLGEFGVLRALGLSPGQLAGILSLEGLGTVLLGLAGGVLIGLGLTAALRPFLALTLDDAIGGGFAHAIVVDWWAAAGRVAALFGLYVLALLVVLAWLLRAGMGRLTRLGDE